MTLKCCIIHHIKRDASGGPIVDNLRDEENSSVGPTLSLFEQFKRTYLRSAQKQYGFFDPEQSENALPGWIADQMSGGSSFASFSRRCMEQLKLSLAVTEEPFSAHILFTHESIEDKDILSIFWLNHSEAMYVPVVDLEPDTVLYLDTSRLKYGARLNVSDWQGDDEEKSKKCLTLIASRGDKPLADAFTAFLGFTEGIDTKVDTSEFLEIVDQFATTLPEEKAKEYRSRVMDYCVEQDQMGEAVVIKELSGHLDEKAPDQFHEFIVQQQAEPKAAFHPHRNSLKRYVRFFGRDRNMSISFSADAFGGEIEYNEYTGTLTIKEVPKSLKDQLMKHLHKAPSAPVVNQTAANTALSDAASDMSVSDEVYEEA